MPLKSTKNRMVNDIQCYITNYEDLHLQNQNELSKVQYQAQFTNKKVIKLRPYRMCFTALNSMMPLTE